MFDLDRYKELQTARSNGTMTDDEAQELYQLCENILFDMITGDPELRAMFARLKDR